MRTKLIYEQLTIRSLWLQYVLGLCYTVWIFARKVILERLKYSQILHLKYLYDNRTLYKHIDISNNELIMILWLYGFRNETLVHSNGLFSSTIVFVLIWIKHILIELRPTRGIAREIPTASFWVKSISFGGCYYISFPSATVLLPLGSRYSQANSRDRCRKWSWLSIHRHVYFAIDN